MTFPTIPTSGNSRVTGATIPNTTSTRTLSGLNLLTKNAGDLLIAICLIYDGNSTNAEFSSWSGGFTEFGDFATTATLSIGCAYKFSDGTETAAVTVASTASQTGHGAYFLLSIAGAHASTPPEAGGYATGTTAPDPGSFNPTGWDVEDTLWIAVGGSGETGTGGSFTGMGATPPTGYTDLFSTGISSDVVGGIDAAIAFRQNAAASEDPGSFSAADTSNSRAGAITIAVRPVASPDATVTPAAVAATVGVPTPTQIGQAVYARVFDGTADNVTCAIGSLANLRDGDLTIAALVKKNASKDQGLVEFHDAGGIRCGLILASDNSIGLQDNAAGATVALAATTNWNVIVVTRSGSTVEGHRYDYGTTTWTHNATASVTAVNDTLTQVRLGGPGFGDLNGRLAVAAAQAGTAFTDGQIETLAVGLQEWVDLFTGGAVWTLDQSSTATAVPDIVGTADQTALSGTTTAVDGPSPFDWELGGGTNATATPAVVAATAALTRPDVNVRAGPLVLPASAALPSSNRNVAAGPVAVAATATLPQATATGGGAPAVAFLTSTIRMG